MAPGMKSLILSTWVGVAAAVSLGSTRANLTLACTFTTDTMLSMSRSDLWHTDVARASPGEFCGGT